MLIAGVMLSGHRAPSHLILAEPTFTQYALGTAAGFAIGVVAALMGVAGGELIIPTIVVIFGLDAKLAGSLSLAISLPTMITAFARYSRDRSFVVLKLNSVFAQLMAAGSVLGAFCGGLLLGIVPTTYLLPTLAVVLLVSAFRIWRHASAKNDAGSAEGVTFRFEPDDVRALTYIPLRFRMTLDLCALHLSQRQWNSLPHPARRALIEAPCRSDSEATQLREVIVRAVHEAGGGVVSEIQMQEPLWRSREVPAQVRAMLDSLQLPLIGTDAWCEMSDDRRFALLKLTRQGHARNLESALREFGL